MALAKLLLGLAISVILLILFFSVSRYFKGLVLVADFLALLSTILLSIDASRVIRRERRSGEPLKFLGAALGIPQVALGTAMLGIGFVCPFIGAYEIYKNFLIGKFVVLPFVGIIIAFLMLGLGYYYLREGLYLMRCLRSASDPDRCRENQTWH